MRYAQLVDRIAGEATDAWDLHFVAGQAKGRGEDVIVLTIGDPDFATPSAFTEAGIAALRSGDTHYGDMDGRQKLRAAIARRFNRHAGVHVHAENVVVTAGAQNALYGVARCIVQEGDEVIALDPTYLTYDAVIRGTGARLVQSPQPPSQNFRVDLAALEGRVTPRTRAIFFASPNNPTGTVLGREEVEGKEHGPLKTAVDALADLAPALGDSDRIEELHVEPDAGISVRLAKQDLYLRLGAPPFDLSRLKAVSETLAARGIRAKEITLGGERRHIQADHAAVGIRREAHVARLNSLGNFRQGAGIVYSGFASGDALRLGFRLFRQLRRLAGPDLVLVQSPPAFPTLEVARLALRRKGVRFIVDWHNLGYSLLQRRLGRALRHGLGCIAHPVMVLAADGPPPSCEAFSSVLRKTLRVQTAWCRCSS